MKLDAFCHVMPRPYAEALSSLTDTPAAANIRNRIDGIPSLVDLDLRFRQMDEFGDDYRQIVSLPAPPPEDLGDPKTSREMAALANDELAALVEAHPDRFAGWVAAVPMNDPEAAVAEAERAIGLGALGVQIYTNVNGHPLDETRFDPFWARMAELDRMIWVHPSRSAAFPDYVTEEKSRYEIWWVFGWPYETSAFMSRIVFSGVFDRHPNLKILTHHAGAMVPFFAGRVGPGWDQLGARTPPDRREEVEGPELAMRPIDYFRMFYADTAVFGAAPALRCALDFFGVDHVLFASDSPFDPEKGPGYIRSTIENIESLGLSDADRAQLYEGNARSVIGV
jgi:predicted TIM-barrel fold metal-dependent hydrolase